MKRDAAVESFASHMDAKYVLAERQPDDGPRQRRWELDLLETLRRDIRRLQCWLETPTNENLSKAASWIADARFVYDHEREYHEPEYHDDATYAIGVIGTVGFAHRHPVAEWTQDDWARLLVATYEPLREVKFVIEGLIDEMRGASDGSVGGEPNS